MSGTSSYQISKAAQQDLISIGRYTQQTYGELQRHHYLQLFAEAFTKLADNPYMGRDINHVYPNCRQWIVGMHIVIYCVTEKLTPRILRIIHQNQQIAYSLLVFDNNDKPDEITNDWFH